MTSLALTDTTSASDDADAYEHTLRELRERTEALTDALDGADVRRGPIGRNAALRDLHTRLRGMAALANHALGGWPDTQDPQ
ncbi:hypothetical protein ACQP2F_33485 [Actinoplanes sp. CA-030573]|uniref:hypothetical protein n=1 Tax=Actinoplanes sp. CA-030573 TaxID=3239898 RepID=UPI003D8C6FD4